MPRRAAYFALPLMLLTGLVLGQLAAISSQPAGTMSSRRPESQAAPIAEAFYQAVNFFLATGDSGRLSELLAKEYQGHVHYQDEGETGDELIRYLGTLRETFPRLQMRVIELFGQFDTVAVDIALTGMTGAFGDIAIDADNDGGKYEFLRIENDRVAERWSNASMPPLVKSVTHTCVPIDTQGELVVSLQRWTFDDGARAEYKEERPFLLVAETGAVTVGEGSADPDEWVLLSAPDYSGEGARNLPQVTSLMVPGGMPVRLQNVSLAPSTLVQIAIRSMLNAPVAVQAGKASRGFHHEELVSQGGPVAPVQNGGYRVSVGLMALPPGSSVPSHEVSRSELVSVVSGSINVAVFGDPAVWYPGDGRLAVVLNDQVVQAGEGIRGNPGTSMAYRPEGEAPALFWLVSIEEWSVEMATPSPTAEVLASYGLDKDDSGSALCVNAPDG